MSVLDQVRADTVRAMKAGDKATVTALRLLTSELQREHKEGRGDEAGVLRRERKRRLEAADQFAGAGRPELAAQERAEAELIAAYLPPELDDTTLATIVAAAVAETGATTVRDLGGVMKLVMARTDGQVDGKRAQAAVREALS
ncbi:GatB/YqeY domain-containing protein [Conexibacter sp. DBS9H8]|uniref:GatB/YqeY domain-containing protein n=1 Tax=Conexibacter sp. DBS9H8 TaxID=2937801 RepID=UPI00200EFF38|nr:GatB/YqeY domain-containing protein [Conexibacter sp. DBS9H8]